MRWREALAGAVLSSVVCAGAATANPVELVSRANPVLSSSGYSNPHALSEDGRYLVFSSSAPNVVPGQVDGNVNYDLFLLDRVTGVRTLISHVPEAPAQAANQGSYGARISSDGRFVVFGSLATNLVKSGEDTNQALDLFLWERETGEVRLLTHALGAPRRAANRETSEYFLSGDGRYLAFSSRATDLVAESDQNAELDVFVKDLVSGATTLVSRSASAPGSTATGWASLSALSRDGRTIVLTSAAPDLVPGQVDSNAISDVFRFDRTSGTMTLVSHTAGSAVTAAGGWGAGISDDGSRVAFLSYGSNLAPGQIDGVGLDAFLQDTATGTNALVTHTPASRNQASNDQLQSLRLSGDGRFLLVFTRTHNLSPGVTDTIEWIQDVYLYDVASGSFTLLSHPHGAPQVAAGVTGGGSLSSDGRFVAFSSTGAIAPGQTGGAFSNVFLWDRTTGVSVLVSHATGAPSQGGEGESWSSLLSSDGNWVAYTSLASNLVAGRIDPPRFEEEAFLYERASGQNRAVADRDRGLPSFTPEGRSEGFALSADGSHVAFLSDAAHLVPGQIDVIYDPWTGAEATDDIFLLDRTTGTTRLVSHAPGAPLQARGGYSPALSADGRLVAFQMREPGFNDQIYLFDGDTGGLTLVSHASTSPAQLSNGRSSLPRISADGRWIAFQSAASNLVPGQQPGASPWDNVFLYDRLAGTSRMVSHRSGAPATPGNQGASSHVLSADGRWIAFASESTDLVAGQVDPGTADDVFLWDRETGASVLVSHRADALGTACGSAGWAGAWPLKISADGRWLLYASDCTNLVPGQVDTNGKTDIFLYDRLSGGSVLVSRAAGTAATAANGESLDGALDADGSTVILHSHATNLVSGVTDANAWADIYRYDVSTGTAALVSHSQAGAQVAAGAAWGELSGDGSRVVYTSLAPDIVPGQIDPGPVSYDVFLYDMAARTTQLLSHAPGSPSQAARRSFSMRNGSAISADGSCAGLYSSAPLHPLDFNDWPDVFLHCDELPAADLAIAKTDGRNTAAPGETLTYTITVTNQGPTPVFGAAVRDDLPAGLGAASWTCAPSTGGACAASGTGSLADQVHLPVGGSAVYTLTARVAPGATGTVANTATVAAPADMTDSQAGNDSATDTDTLAPQADLAISLADAPDPVDRGGTVTYTAAVTNLGPSDAPSPSVQAALPAGSTFLEAVGEGWSCGAASGTVTCGRGTLGVGAAPALQIRLTAPTAGTAISLTAGVASAVPDPVAANDSDTESTGVLQAGVVVSPLSGLVTSERGQTATFTVALRRQPAADVRVTVASGDTSEGLASPAEVLFTPGNWNAPQTVTVTGQWDDQADGHRVYTVHVGPVASDDPEYQGLDAPDVTAINQDAGTGELWTVTPCRLLDTRRPEDGPALASGNPALLAVFGSCDIPATAQAVAVNVTVLQSAGAGYLTLYPGDAQPPLASTLNFAAGQLRSNNAAVPLALDGSGTLALRASVAGNGTVHVILDVVGYFE